VIRCGEPDSDIIDIAVELSRNHIFYVLIDSGEILVYDVKFSKKFCKGKPLHFTDSVLHHQLTELRGT